jgi:uncharacterized protein (DUF1810 family)
MADDPHNLNRFIDAQAPVIDRVRAELAQGRKRSHWMWFIFPQIAGLGFSPMAQLYAIASLNEARAYLVHPVLGRRLEDCTRLVLAIEGHTASDIFGWPDDMKFRSSMTLFAQAAPDNPVFAEALSKYFDGDPDPETLKRL